MWRSAASKVMWVGRPTVFLIALCAVTAVAVAVAMAFGAGPTSAQQTVNNSRVKNLQAISGPSPFAGPGKEECGDTSTNPITGERNTNYITNFEVEPHIAVNPTNPGNLIAAWQQDRGDAARAILAAYSSDGGATWTRVEVPGLTGCQEHPHDDPNEHNHTKSQADPWVAFGPDGTAYLSAPTSYNPNPPFNTVVTVIRSADGGRTWDGPFKLEQPEGHNDFARVVADPYDPTGKTVYATWYNLSTSRPQLTQLYFSKSPDKGETWSEPTLIATDELQAVGGAPTSLPVMNQPLVLRGSESSKPSELLVIYADLDALHLADKTAPVPAKYYASRSTDGGETWSKRVFIGTTGDLIQPQDNEAGKVFDAPAVSTQAVDGKQIAYVVWPYYEDPNRKPTPTGKLMLSKSLDGGVSWSDPEAIVNSVGHPYLTFAPTIAAGKDGSLGLTWYDTRADRPGSEDDGKLPTQAWFAKSHDGGETWSETPLDGTFDLREVPGFGFGANSHGFLGDYFGLAPLPGGRFGAVFTQAVNPEGNPTDVFFARAR